MSHGKVYSQKEWERIVNAEAQVEHFDLLQLTKKIQLNSAYGALLNENFRWGRREIGASVTGTGRQITWHMGETIGKLATGRRVHFRKRFADGDLAEDGAPFPSSKRMSSRIKGLDGDNMERLISTGERYDISLKKLFGGGSVSSAGNGNTFVEGRLPSVLRMNGLEKVLACFAEEQPFNLVKDIESGEMKIMPAGAIYWAEFDDQSGCKEIVYGDTDSCYFLTGAANYEEAVEVADKIAADTNATFPKFMSEAFNCTDGREKLIAAAREIVAERGLFMLAKKKYTLRVVNLDGQDLREKPKLKSMGSEIKKADTPKAVQDFLKELMDLVLTGEPYLVLEAFINKHRGTMINKDTNVLELAPAKQVNNLDEYYAEYKRTEKIGRGKMKVCPGHVRAAINYNEVSEKYDPGGLKPMKAGDKAAILYLKPNHAGLKSIGFPTDTLHLPTWFVENFQVDLALTEAKMIDAKVEGIFEAMGMETPTLQRSHLNKMFTF